MNKGFLFAIAAFSTMLLWAGNDQGKWHNHTANNMITSDLNEGKQATAPANFQPIPSASTAFEDTTRRIMALVNDAAALIAKKGEGAFRDFRKRGSQWRQGETYIFVLDPAGYMMVHPDRTMQGRNEMELKDINGKPIIRGLIDAATITPGKPYGWYHYLWPEPDGLLPRWKSSYVQLATAPSGKQFIVGSGVYNDRMEKEFVVDLVHEAIAVIEQKGEAAYPFFHDPTSQFLAKDAYIFVVDQQGVEHVDPPFPTLEGTNILDLKDSHGKLLVREMLKLVKEHGSGWVEYMWPKPGESVSTQKSTYVSKARMGDQWVLVGCGVYLADAPKAVVTAPKMSANELMSLVREGARVFEQQGEKAFAQFREKGSKWFRDDTYFFVWTMDGVRILNAANPETEGVNVAGLKDALGRPFGRMFLDAAASPAGQGWIHYQNHEPGDIFPTWKSSFVMRVNAPSGQPYLIGSGIYNMQMDRAFIEDVVNRAADLVAQRGKDAFPLLRDKTGPFMFMDTYVFVNDLKGVELVNPGVPAFEGRNLMNLKDVKGKRPVREYIAAALKKGSAWVDYYGYRPGTNEPAHKFTFVRKVQHGSETFIVGSGLYEPEQGEEQKKKLAAKLD